MNEPLCVRPATTFAGAGSGEDWGAFGGARRRAGLEAEKGGEQIVVYHARHLRITELAPIAGDPKMLMALTGHRSLKTVLRYMRPNRAVLANLPLLLNFCAQ